MTYWADNIKFIKDILESKYKKIDDAMLEVSAGYFTSTTCMIIYSMVVPTALEQLLANCEDYRMLNKVILP